MKRLLFLLVVMALILLIVVRLGLGEIWGIAFIWNQGDLVKITTDDDWEEEFSRVWDVDSVVTILTVINYGFWQLGGR